MQNLFFTGVVPINVYRFTKIAMVKKKNTLQYAYTGRFVQKTRLFTDSISSCALLAFVVSPCVRVCVPPVLLLP